jgi:hypothetical protein
LDFGDMSQEFKDHAEAGEEYTCDKCNKTKLNVNEYDQYIKFQYHYCEPCWNYIHLKKGTCTCGNVMTNRSEKSNIFITCGCGSKVELKW